MQRDILLFAKEKKVKKSNITIFFSLHHHHKKNGVYQGAKENNSADIRTLNKHQFGIVVSCIWMAEKRMKYGRIYLTEHVRMRYRSEEK